MALSFFASPFGVRAFKFPPLQNGLALPRPDHERFGHMRSLGQGNAVSVKFRRILYFLSGFFLSLPFLFQSGVRGLTFLPPSLSTRSACPPFFA